MEKKRIIWFSCGENCMPIDILRRHNLEAPSTPFSSCRSNIEHLLYFEDNQYEKYIESDYLIEANAWSEKCYLNIAEKSEGNFRQGRHSYLEFTHQNLKNQEDINKLKRRITRQLNARSSSVHVVLFYHHRSRDGFINVEKTLIKNFERILSRYKNANALCYTQKIVKSNERGINIKTNALNNIKLATLNTTMEWGGHNKDIFFGRHDDDLFGKLIKWYYENLFE